ncbi:MAG: aminotransferase class I/II-fold pyridoxal phosphate-dependent enzyme [Planctomycetes bacterium]|nr:aminotransferase class I/II-fold pyridoxal phosphate-dependent enzyme [Planctomycetota bacterium]
MQFAPFQYMRYAKRLEYASGIFLAGSGMAVPKPDQFSIKPEDVGLDSMCASYGDPRNVNWLADSLRCSGEQVVLASGSSSANTLVFMAAVTTGDKVIIETPGYPQFYSLASIVGAEVIKLPRVFENDFLPDIEQFKKLMAHKPKLIVLTNLHNPSMARIPQDMLKQMIDIAAEVGAIVLVDEVYLDHLKIGDADASAFTLGENVAIPSSLTKVYGLGALRLGWAAAPEKLAARMLDLADVIDPELSPVTQKIAFRGLQALSKLRPLARTLHEKRWPIMKEWLDSRKDVQHFHPPGGITVWLRVDGITETGNLAGIAQRDYGVLIVPGEYFQAPGWLRIGYKIEPSTLRQGLEQLGKAIDDVRSHQ